MPIFGKSLAWGRILAQGSGSKAYRPNTILGVRERRMEEFVDFLQSRRIVGRIAAASDSASAFTAPK
jgi:hypothetical protein